ncbi:MAG TPA: glycerophosphodiester phosphodiesterase family protein [Candidatus Izemoplasmatales bacterium]|nr:glycerophosphodiester phosphodiesterase family protein [Candidatus Izemoplasmatales bacterium]
MKKLLLPIKKLIFFDIKKLILIESMIKIIGFLLVFPIFRIAFYYSLQLSGLKYISNSDLIFYLTRPTTIIIAIFVVLVFSIYLLLEYAFLTLLYEHAINGDIIYYKRFFIKGFMRFFYSLGRYHFFLILPIFLFFVLFEYVQISLFSTAIKLPEVVLVELTSMQSRPWIFILVFVLLFVFFTETVAFTHGLVLEQKTIKKTWIIARKIITKKRIKFIYNIIIFNLLIHIFLIVFYAITILLINLFISVFKNSNIAFGIMITSMYSFYWIINFIFVSILIPVNIAIISYIYHKPKRHFIQPAMPVIQTQKPIRRLATIGIGLTFIIVFSINIVSITSSIQETQDQFQIFKQETIIAHRGASYDAPENTIASLEVAIEQGSDAVEFDVRTTKDNVPILMHDDTLKRTTDFDINLKVDDLSFDIIRNYEAGSWFSEAYAGEKIPTLEEALETVQGRVGVFMDIKTENKIVEKEIMRLIEFYDMVDDVKIMSFSLAQLQRFKALNPNIETILLISSYYGQINLLYTNDSINHFGLRISIIERAPNIINEIHQEGKNVYVWKIDSEKQINIGVSADVDGFITSRPVLAREVAHSKASNESFKEILERLFKQ